MAGEKFVPSLFSRGGAAFTWYGTLERLRLNRVERRNGEFHE